VGIDGARRCSAPMNHDVDPALAKSSLERGMDTKLAIQ
jgi:hypothetical protein